MNRMPNLRGGKAYKKGKKAAPQEEKVGKFFKRDADQDYARVLKMLGNRRVVCFCNDGKERICKIRGALCKGPKKERIETGDIVLISFRDFDGEDESEEEELDEEGKKKEKKKTIVADVDGINVVAHVSGRKDIADIINKFHRDHWRYIKKDDGIHKDLFFVSAEDAAADDLFDYGEDKKEEEKEKEELDDKDIDAI